jgi:hypothetical protein
MTVASPLTFPGSRVVAGWWRQLAPLQPHALWIGHFLLRRVEALVEVSRPLQLDTLSRLVLQALTLPGSRTPHGLDARLNLGAQVVLRVLLRLQAEALVLPGAGGEWEPAPFARRALEQADAELPDFERRRFSFIAPWPGPDDSELPPRFLNLAAALATPIPEGATFDPSLLTACVERPADWKSRHGFPSDVRSVLLPGSTGPRNSVPEWRHVILVQPEHLLGLLALLHPQNDDEQLVGFGVQPEGWVLHAAQPAFVLDASWQESFPELAADPPPEVWREALRAWGQPRNLPQAETDACTLERHGCRLRVRAPRRLVDRLRVARSDAVKGEAWLVAGTGSLRSLALLEVVETEATPAPPGRGPG